MGQFIITPILILSVVFFIFMCGVLACWNDGVLNWQLMFGHKVGTKLYNFNIQVNNYFKNFWK